MATILGSAMAFMDGSVVNVALPILQAQFRTTSSEIQWVIQSYALFGASLLLLGGAIGDRFGRRRAFAWGVALFAVASAGCAASQSLPQLVVARAVQGVGAALLVPQGLAILSASFAEDERGGAIGTWSAWTSVFSALGPVAGGWLMQVWSWRLIFLLNIPFAIAVLALAPRIPESRASTANTERSLDWLGAALNTLSLAALLYAVSYAPQLGWRNPWVAALLGTGLLLLAGFLWSQAARSDAMMPLSLFAIPRFMAANLLTFLLYGSLGGALYAIPFYLIQVRHYAPAEAGAVFLPLIALMFFLSPRVGALVPRVGERTLLSAGAIASGLGFAALSWLDGLPGYARAVFPGVLLLGVGMTLTVSPLSTAVMSSVPESRTGIASAVNNAISRLAGLAAVSVVALLLAAGFSVSLEQQLSRSGLPAEAKVAMLAGKAHLHELAIPSTLEPAQRAVAASILDQAFLAGFHWVMLGCSCSAWAGALAVLLFLRKQPFVHSA